MATALVATACGSQVDPTTVGAVTGGQIGGGTVPGAVDQATGGVLDGSDDLGAGVDLGGSSAGGISNPGGSVDGGSSGDSGAGASGGSGQVGGGSGDSGGGDPGGNVKAASCDGFKNQTGITDSEIVIGNASDISGPVPGLFEASQDAVKAYIAYFNASNDICGRKLTLVTYDSRTDAGADQQAHAKACPEVFAMVGSMSGFDSGGAPVAEDCGLPDVRSAAVTAERNACQTCFGAQSTFTSQVPNAIPDWIKKNYGSSAQKAGYLYINAGAAAQNGVNQSAGFTKRGMKFLVREGIDVSEFNYAPYVQQLKDAGVEVVFWTGAWQQSVKLRQTMTQQGYSPKLYMRDPTDYNQGYVSQGGSSVDGTVIYMNFLPFEEASSNTQMQTYLSWLRQVKPSAEPTFFGVFSWSAAELFVQKALGLGGKLSRSTMIEAVRKTADWTNDGMHSPQQVGPKETNECLRFIQLKGERWVPLGGTKLLCSGLSTA